MSSVSTSRQSTLTESAGPCSATFRTTTIGIFALAICRRPGGSTTSGAFVTVGGGPNVGEASKLWWGDALRVAPIPLKSE